MVTYKEVDAAPLIKAVASELKTNPSLKAPAWAPFVKTGAHKELPPTDNEWWYTRAAAVLRKVAVYGPIGTNKLVVMYGGKKRRGHKKPTFATGSGSVARKCLQQLEKAGLIKHVQQGTHKGRVVTPAGQKMLDNLAYKIAKQ